MDAAADIPFRFNEIRNIQLVEARDSNTTFEDLLLHQEDWKWTDKKGNVLAKKDNVYWLKAQLIGMNFLMENRYSMLVILGWSSLYLNM